MKRVNVNLQKRLLISILIIVGISIILPLVLGQSTDPIRDMANIFQTWQEGGNFSPIFAKYLFWALISMVLFTVIANFPGLDNPQYEWIRWIVAIIVGFLGMAYITPEEIYGLMITYSAMGFAIGVIIPIMVLGAFTFSIARDNSLGRYNLSTMMFRKTMVYVLWWAYLLYLGVKGIQLISGSVSEGSVSNSYVPFLMVIFFIIAGIMCFGGVRKMFDMIAKSTAKDAAREYRRRSQLAGSAINTDARRVTDTVNSRRADDEMVD